MEHISLPADGSQKGDNLGNKAGASSENTGNFP